LLKYAGKGLFGQIVIKLLKWLKKLNLQFMLLYLRYMWALWGLVENVIWGKGLAENVKYRHMRGGGLKLLKKPSYDI